MELFESRRTKFLRAFFLLFPALLLVLSCTLFVAGVSSTSDQAVHKEQDALEQALKNGAIRTYALTGTYPESLSQLLLDYHITYDKTKFVVEYVPNGSNLLPSISVIALSGSLGTPWPWLRLSVIGALHYETQVAQAAAEQVGMHALSAAEMTPQGFTTIALLMSVCIMWGMILSIFFNKRYLKRLGNDGAKSASGVGFGDSAMTAMFIGLVCAYIGSYIGAFVSGEGLFTCTGDWTPLIVVAVSAAVMALFVYLAEKKNMAWLESFSIAGSMLIGMAAAVLVRL